MAARPRIAQQLDAAWLASWLAERTSVIPEQLDHIREDKRDEPGIVVEVAGCPPGGQPQPFRILIDGTHRAARKLRDAQDCWAYLLTEEEQRSICTYRRGSRISEMPMFAGRGVDDRDAGILLASPAASNDVA